MTITLCLVPFIPSTVRSERSGFNLFPYSIFKGDYILQPAGVVYMKNYSYLRTISYDVTILIHYSKGQGSKLSIFKSFVLWGVGFETHKMFIIGT